MYFNASAHSWVGAGASAQTISGSYACNMMNEEDDRSLQKKRPTRKKNYNEFDID